MIITVLSWSLLGLASSLPEHVDQAPAHEVADRFFAALGSSEPSSAMNEFSDGFKAEVRLWPAALSSMHKQFGPVTSKVLSGSALAANEREPCFVLDYQIVRTRLDSAEKLLVCRVSKSQDWKIFGHTLTRSDTGQTLRAGLMPSTTPPPASQ
jgi:hypothetical protein